MKTKFKLVFAFMFAVLSFSGCGMARDITYIKQKTFGVGNVETQEELEKNIRVKSKKRKINKVKVEQNVIYTPEIGYGSVSKEERLKYSDKTDNKYGLFRYRLYYDYLIPETIQVFIDVDSNFYFSSAVDQDGTEFNLIPSWPKDHLFNSLTNYVELYTIYLPFEYVEAHQDDSAIVIDLLSDKKGHANNFATALTSKASDLSRTFHIPQYYIKGFLNAIEQHKPLQNDDNAK